MKRTLVLGALVALGTLTAAVSALQQPPAAAPPSAAQLVADKVRDNLYVLRSAEASVFSGGNTAVFVMTNGVLLVDTKNPGWGQPIIDKVKELTSKPVTHIINTHTHFDHVSGNVEFPATVEVVTHENTAKLMTEMRPVTGLAQTGPPQNIFKDNNGRGLPKRTFRDRMTLGSGNDRVELHYFGRAHTGGDAFVVFPALRVMHTGDAFPNRGLPIIDANNDGSGVEYPDTVAKAAGLPNIDTVITGHNTTTVTMADVKMYSEFNREFLEAVRAAKKAGQTIDDVAKTWKVPERFLKAGYAEAAAARLRTNTEVVWNELK